MPTVGFEPTVSAGERPQTYVLDHAATGTGTSVHSSDVFILSWSRETSEHISMKLFIPVGDSAPDFVGQI